MEVIEHNLLFIAGLSFIVPQERIISVCILLEKKRSRKSTKKAKRLGWHLR